MVDSVVLGLIVLALLLVSLNYVLVHLPFDVCEPKQLIVLSFESLDVVLVLQLPLVDFDFELVHVAHSAKFLVGELLLRAGKSLAKDLLLL